MNKQMSTETKYPCFKGLINILEESEKIDFNEMMKTQVESLFVWPAVLRDFFEFYAIFYEGLSFQAFLHKGILQYLETTVNQKLKETEFGEALIKIIQQTSEEQITPYFEKDQGDANLDEKTVEVIRISNEEYEMDFELNKINPDVEKLEVAEMGLVIEVNPKDTPRSTIGKDTIIHKLAKAVEQKDDTDPITWLHKELSDDQKEILKSL